MEQQRMTLALVLCFAVWFGWMLLFAPKRLPSANNAPPANNAVDAPTNQPAGGNGGPVALPEGPFQHPKVDDALVTAKTKLHDIVFTNRGGAIQSLGLIGVLDKRDGVELQLLQAFDPTSLSLMSGIDHPNDPALSANWEVLPPAADELARFRFTYPVGIELTKSYRADGDRCGLKVRIEARNRAATPLPVALRVAGAGGIQHDDLDAQFHLGVHAHVNDKDRWTLTEDITLDRLKKEGSVVVPAQTKHWAAVNNKYFATVLDPEGDLQPVDFVYRRIRVEKTYNELVEKLRTGAEAAPTPEALAEAASAASKDLTVTARYAPVSVDPEKSIAIDLLFYAGPRRADALDTYAKEGYPNLLDYGWFSAIANLLLGILGFFHGIFGNYGLAVIALTMTVKACLFPLTKKGQISAFRMQQVAPKMNAIKEKYENDKERLNVEMLKLYREHGVNPFTGCLPMFFQLPVFLGLYRGLERSFELRQAPFFGWIGDLSRPDHLFTLPFQIPFLSTNEFHLLPIIMTVTWYIQSTMQPKTTDPNMAAQQKMMQFMPVFFGFLLYNMPAGLTLYWLTSTLLGIFEQRYIKTHHLKA